MRSEDLKEIILVIAEQNEALCRIIDDVPAILISPSVRSEIKRFLALGHELQVKVKEV
jgi:hypothetical protein